MKMKIDASNLTECPGIGHGFFGRKGGVSAGIYESLNCGPGSRDDLEHVLENRRRALAALIGGESRLVTLHQVHSAKGVVVDEPWQIGNGPKADAMATNVPGIALGILTADCAPILFADAEARVIGAAHAGWKGSFSGVVEQAIVRMEELGAKRGRIAAAIGPCISQSAYEVGNEFREIFTSDDAANTRFFAAAGRSDHWQFDLPAYVRMRIDAAGIRNVAAIACCTYAESENLYSFRRTTHRRESDYGRQLSAIVLE
jgi:hypothetical protein